MLVDWERATAKQLPVRIMRKDYIIHDEDLGDPKEYHEYSTLLQLYQNDFNIFEQVISNGILSGKVKITSQQLTRICSPVLCNNNKSLLHYLCYRRYDDLL